ncbi:pyridoxamine 5'-phosphate oxidase family protein [Neobacillus niacini]|uniref:pyridoxamine 5'-phosphate oxidase family protein n=1 Tax=Neobacillus niacini TaxID=86668 RepID=UPI0021CB4FC7|nr:pyridoxamine 5'-phosphate oxidase family protein [Neobacillus niacini]MCM3765169.1 pyridoxamine 5'-phosphate oxidase family protein [Neobacillus niacini]
MDYFKNKVETDEELRSIIGFPSELASKKVISYIDSHCAEFIAKSPFLVLATADEHGYCDVSPRGDMPGFVYVLNEKQVVIPERPGNKRLDSLRNILSNPKIGLLFFIPGLKETLRINGKAAIIKDVELLEKMAVKGKIPLLGIGVEVEECFVHCAKALKRSSLWDTGSWPAKEALPSAAKILFEHAKLPNSTVDTIQKGLEESYTKRLY